MEASDLYLQTSSGIIRRNAINFVLLEEDVFALYVEGMSHPVYFPKTEGEWIISYLSPKFVYQEDQTEE